VRLGRSELFDLKVDPDEEKNLIRDPRFRDLVPVWQRALDEFTATVTH
jgi:hypothetical protein